MNIKLCIGGLAALCLLATGLAACSKAEPAKAATAPAGAWTLVTTSAHRLQAGRTVVLDGGGELLMVLSCDYRPNTDPIMNGFWLKLELELIGTDGVSLGLDPLTTEGQTARFAVVRSTGEGGSMGLAISDPTHLVYENNQTNALNQDNDNPASVELAQKFDLPLSDGRTVSIDMQKHDPGYRSVIETCASLRANR